MTRHTDPINLHNTQLATATYTAGMLQAQAYRALKGFMAEQLHKPGLTMQEWALLGILREHGRQRLSAIADRMNVEASLSTTLAGRLLKKQLIERLPDSTDRRAKLITLTPKGSRLVDSTEQQIRSAMRLFLDDVSPAELIVYIGVMAKIAAKKTTPS
jgi:DNA-binding MarR family transcriptional regulator